MGLTVNQCVAHTFDATLRQFEISAHVMLKLGELGNDLLSLGDLIPVPLRICLRGHRQDMHFVINSVDNLSEDCWPSVHVSLTLL